MDWRTVISAFLIFLTKLLRLDEVRDEPPDSPEFQGGNSNDPGPTVESEFRIYGHQSWHTYTCYLSTSIDNFEDAARRLLESGFTKFVSLPDGRIGWCDGEGALFGSPIVENSFGLESLRLPRDLDPTLKIPAFMVSLSRYGERHLLGSNDIPEPHMRIHLPPIRLHIEDYYIDAEIEIIITSSGLTLLSFNIDERCDLELSHFIRERVNLMLSKIDVADMDPEFFYCAGEAVVADTENSSSLWGRWQLLRGQNSIKKAMKPQSRKDGSQYIPMKNPGAATLGGVGFEIIQAMAYYLSDRRHGLAYLIFGAPPQIRWTGFWRASPHIHLTNFSRQSTSAHENEHIHRDALLRILSRSARDTDRLRELSLPKNLRAFDDFGLYINEAMILWVHVSPQATPHGKPTNAPEQFIYAPTTIQQEVVGEVIELGPMMYMSLLHELEDHTLRWDRILPIKETISRFERLLVVDAGAYGEIRNVIREGFEARALPQLRDLAEKAIELRERSSALVESRRFNTTGIILSIMVGIIGLPDLIDFLNRNITGGTMPLWSSMMVILGVYLLVVLLVLRTANKRSWLHIETKPKRG